MKLFHVFGGLLAAGMMIGCGGGGSGGHSDVGVFLTDDMNTGYDHVWVSVQKVELQKQNGAMVTVINEGAGETVDLRALNSSGTSLYAFLGANRVPNDTYTGMRITLAKDLVVYPTGAAVGTPVQFADTYNGDAGTSRFTFSFGAPKVVPGTSNVVADFDLSQWVISGSTVTVVVKEGVGTGLEDPTKQVRLDYRGTVGSISGTAPSYSFVLTTAAGDRFKVKTDTTTAFFGADGSNPTLNDNSLVTVRGVYSTTDGALTARYVRIDPAGSADNPSVYGVPSNANAGAGTLDVTLGTASGFVPSNTAIHVTTNSSTKFFSSHGTAYGSQADFFAAMAADPTAKVEVEGVYSSGTVAATVVQLDDEQSDAGGELGVVGTVETSPGIDPNAGTFTLAAADWSGSILTTGANVNVVTTPTTVYKVGAIVSDKATYFSTITVGMSGVKAEGAYDPTTRTLTATSLGTGG